MRATGQAMEERIVEYVEQHSGRLFTLIGDLVRINSENMPPRGNEGDCQQYAASVLRVAGWKPDLYMLPDVAGLRDHPLYVGGREYAGRPNLGACQKGVGRGRSLILSGHMDTVPRGTQRWTRDAFGGEVEGNHLYGRGSNDMKAGVAMNLFVAEALRELDLKLAGDLTIEAVVDEEFGGVNGTLAGRVRGYLADAAVITEPSFLRICAAQRGGRTAHITFSGAGGVLSEGAYPAGVVEQVTHFLSELPKFAAERRRGAQPHPFYAQHPDPVPVSVTKIFTAPWGTGEPITTPEECKVELYWQLMPGETRKDVERDFFEWLQQMMSSAPDLFARKPAVEFPIRWLPGSAIDPSQPLVTELSWCATSILNEPPPVVGIEGPCDLFVFHEFGIPAVLWGPRGGSTHGADEYVELDSVIVAVKALLLFVCRWCEVV